MKLKQEWDKLTKGWFGTFVYIVLGFIIAYAVIYGLGIVLNTDTPVVAVFSESMIPVLNKGDMIFVYNSGEFVVGDIVVYETSETKRMLGYPIIHRIIDIDNGLIKTKGDHNLVPDPWGPITKDQIHGKVIIKLPLIGWVKIAFTWLVTTIINL